MVTKTYGWEQAEKFKNKVNHGTQARKDIEVMRSEVFKLSRIIVKQQAESQTLNEKIDKLPDVVKFLADENKIHKSAVERLLQELREKDKETKQ